MCEIPLMICVSCRNYACESYTFYGGYFICEYCLDDWLKSEEWEKDEDFDVWCKEHKEKLNKEVLDDTKTKEEVK